jgi:hypothetical protein
MLLLIKRKVCKSITKYKTGRLIKKKTNVPYVKEFQIAPF